MNYEVKVIKKEATFVFAKSGVLFQSATTSLLQGLANY